MGCKMFRNPFKKSTNLVCVMEEITNRPVSALTDMPRSEVCKVLDIASRSCSYSLPITPVSISSLGHAPQMLSGFTYHDELNTNIDASEKGPSQKIKIPRSNTSDDLFAKKYIESRKRASI